jgi:DNA ligase-1
MLLADLTSTSAQVAGLPGRLAKVAAIAGVLERTGADEAATAVAFLTGELRQRQIGVGYRSLRDLPPPAASPTLTLAEVDDAFTRIKAITGAGSVGTRRTAIDDLFARATPDEQAFLVRLLTGELRQGALDGVMVDAIAKATGIPVASVRRAHMLRGSLIEIAATALDGGQAALDAYRLAVGHPLAPMLAGSAPDVAAAFAKVSPADVEWKLDGIRVQVHRDDREVGVYTRSLDDITARVPEIVDAALALPARSFVLDGEAIALRDDGRPHPFQVTASRTGSSADVAAVRDRTPLRAYFFDVLHLDGADLLDAPLHERYAALDSFVPEELRVPRTVTDDVDAAAAFFADAVERGHEGVVVKALDAPYAAGRRGSGWIKVKPRHTLDLVVLAAEWGHGRREGWLSNLHLGARDTENGGFVMLGKTFKGLTDELLTWQTERFLALATSPPDRWTVGVRPELVVEIAFDGVQRSTRYPGGLALRFARVLRYRPDKRADEADTFDAVRALAATD